METEPILYLIGPIASIAPEGVRFWTGKITREKHGNLETREAIELIGQFYVDADPNAQERCIDGRPIEGYETSSALRKRPLGAQSTGGTPGITLAYRIMKAERLPEGRTFTQDLEDTLKICDSIGFYFGGHTDDHAHGHNTGCGAIDRIPDVFQKMLDPQFGVIAEKYLSVMLGEDFDAATMHSLLFRAALLDRKNGTYLEREPGAEGGDFLYRHRVIAAMHQNEREGRTVVENLSGSHNEVALVINMIPGTTFDRDAFAKSQEYERQAFNYDFWLSKDMAGKLFPDANGKNNAQKRKEFLTIRVLLALGTAMVLTDGTIELVIRLKE